MLRYLHKCEAVDDRIEVDVVDLSEVTLKESNRIVCVLIEKQFDTSLDLLETNANLGECAFDEALDVFVS